MHDAIRKTTPKKSISRFPLLLIALLLVAWGLGSCGRPRNENVGALQYAVRRGDTLSQLSRRAGLSIADIIRANNLRTNVLEVGQVLQFPGITTLGPDPLAVKQVAPTAYTLVTRQEWGALPTKSNVDPMQAVTRITIHHTNEIPGMMERSDSEIVKAIARYHRDTRKWADIGYHYLIGRDGRVYEGRPVIYQGAHARGANNVNNLGIALIGDFSKHLPNSLQLHTLETFLQAMQQKYHVPSSKVFGHQHFVNTECPGEALEAWLKHYLATHK